MTEQWLHLLATFPPSRIQKFNQVKPLSEPSSRPSRCELTTPNKIKEPKVMAVTKIGQAPENECNKNQRAESFPEPLELVLKVCS